MAELDRPDLEAFFELNDIPTESQYASLIESVPNFVDDYGSSPAFTRSSQVTILSAAVLGLNTTPVDLVAAPGASLGILPHSVIVKFVDNGTAYTANTDIQVQVDTANALCFLFNNLLEDTATTIKKLNPAFIFGANLNQIVADKALQIQVPGGDPLTGDGDLVVTTTYEVIAV